MKDDGRQIPQKFNTNSYISWSWKSVSYFYFVSFAEMNGFTFFKSKSDPTMFFQKSNPNPNPKINLAYFGFITVIRQYVIQLKHVNK